MKTMGRTLTGATMMAILILTIAASAPQDAKETTSTAATRKIYPPTRIGFVDVTIIYDKAKLIQEIVSKTDEAIEEMMQSLEEMEDKRTRILTELKIKEAVLSEEETAAMGKEARRLEALMVENNVEIKDYLDETRKKKMDPAIKNVLEMVKTVAREEHFDMILSPEAIVYANPSLDISNLVVQRLNAIYKPPPPPKDASAKKAPSISKD